MQSTLFSYGKNSLDIIWVSIIILLNINYSNSDMFSLGGQVVRRRSRKPKTQGSIPCRGSFFLNIEYICVLPEIPIAKTAFVIYYIQQIKFDFVV